MLIAIGSNRRLRSIYGTDNEWNCADNAAQLERSLFIERRKNK